MHRINEHNILIFLIQILVLLMCSAALSAIFRRWKQPALTAEIVVGILLGPTVFGRFLPSFYHMMFPQDAVQYNMLGTLTWLGVFFFLLEIGLEIDFLSLWGQKRAAATIAIAATLVPMAIAFPIALLLPDKYLVNPGQHFIFAAFIATAMAITAMPVAARMLRDLNILKTSLGALIMSAISIQDITGWLTFTLILGFFTRGNPPAVEMVSIISLTITFVIICLTIGKRFVGFILSQIKIRNMPKPITSITFICLVGLLCGSITQKIGIHALFGFFIAGIMAGEAKRFSRSSRVIIAQFVTAFLMPLYFASIGLRLDFIKYLDIPLILGITAVGIMGRFSGAWLGASFIHQQKANRLTIAISYIGGGMMEIVVANLAFDYGLIKESVFIAIVCGAVISSIIMSQWLHHSMKAMQTLA